MKVFCISLSLMLAGCASFHYAKDGQSANEEQLASCQIYSHIPGGFDRCMEQHGYTLVNDE